MGKIDTTAILRRIDPASAQAIDSTSRKGETQRKAMAAMVRASACMTLHSAIEKADDHALFQYRWQVVFANMFETLGVSAVDGMRIISKLGEKVQR